MNRLILAVALLIPALASGQDRLPMRGDSIGINTNIDCNYFGRSYALTDVFRATDPWRAPWGEGREGSKGELILPGENGDQGPLQVNVFAGATDYPLGGYVVTFDGDGDFEVYTDAGVMPFKGPKGRFVADVQARHPQGLVLVCGRSNPKDRVRNVRIWMPGYEGSKSAFTDEYLRSLRGYNCLRFVNDLNTIRGGYYPWQDRAKPGDRRWSTDRGMPIEVLADLANAVGADAWVTIHHRATDDDVRMAARLWKRELGKGRKAYVEYDCEQWNGGFPSADWAKDKFAPPGQTDPKDNVFWSSQTDWYAWRAVQIHRIWEEEWSGSDRARLITVISGQYAVPERGAWMLAKARKFRGGKPCDAYAIGPYFYPTSTVVNGDQSLKDPAISLDALFADLEAGLATVRFDTLRNRKVADDQGVRLIGYEGGQHLHTMADKASNDKYIEANRDPRMAGLYRRYLGTLFDAGLEMVNLYSQGGIFNQYGPWGMVESGAATLDASPKLRGVIEYRQDATGRINPDVLRMPEPAPDGAASPDVVPKAA